MAGLDFQAMRLSDLEAVIALAELLPTAPRWSRLDYVAALAETGPRQRICRVMTDRVRIVGFVVASLVMPEAEIESIAILPELQGQGFGSLLLLDVLRELAGAGATTVHLEVRASNEAARALYRRKGFEESGRRRDYYANPVEDAVLLSRTLGEFQSGISTN